MSFIERFFLRRFYYTYGITLCVCIIYADEITLNLPRKMLVTLHLCRPRRTRRVSESSCLSTVSGCCGAGWWILLNQTLSVSSTSDSRYIHTHTADSIGWLQRNGKDPLYSVYFIHTHSVFESVRISLLESCLVQYIYGFGEEGEGKG